MSDSDRSGKRAVGLLLAGLLACVIGLIAINLNGSLQKLNDLEANYRAEQYAENARVDIQRKCTNIPARPERAGCVNETKEPYRVAERAERDLQAQQTMAIWTRAMGQAAIIGMVVGIVGLVLIFTTFKETRRAADAGLEANKIARENSRQQLRAYLDITNVRWFVSESESPKIGDDRIGIIVKIENFGATPAVDFVAGFKIEKPGVSGGVVTIVSPIKDRLTIVGNNDFIWEDRFYIRNYTLNKILSGDENISILIQVLYRDTFGVCHAVAGQYAVEDGNEIMRLDPKTRICT